MFVTLFLNAKNIVKGIKNEIIAISKLINKHLICFLGTR